MTERTDVAVKVRKLLVTAVAAAALVTVTVVVDRAVTGDAPIPPTTGSPSKRDQQLPLQYPWLKKTAPPIALPAYVEGVPVRDLRVGESGWIRAKNILVDPDRKMWVLTDAEVYADRHEPRRIIRIERRKDGYHIWVSGKASWSRQALPESKTESYAPIESVVWFPIRTLIRIPAP